MPVAGADARGKPVPAAARQWKRRVPVRSEHSAPLLGTLSAHQP